MLVLTRKLNESIVIGNNVKLTILEVRGDQVSIGIEAPPSVKIYRTELYDAIKKANVSSGRVSDDNLEAMSLKLKKKK